MITTVVNKRDKLIKEHIEKVGVAMEQNGFPRMVGRVLGLLIVSEPPYQTFNDIQEYLQASKSSVSTALNTLITQGLVVYITLPGDRKRYFKFNAESWLEMFKKDLCQFTVFKNLILECIEIRSKEDEQFNQALVDIADLYSFLEKEIPVLINRWEQSKK
jgi:DNA-binding transcriptional regulator GbsR (MarR family)